MAEGLPGAGDDAVHLTSDSLHDLAGPVNQIRSLTDLVVKKYGDSLDEDALALFGYVQGATDRLQNLVSGMRRYMQVVRSPGPYLAYDGNALLAEALEMLQYAIAESQAVVTQDLLPVLWCDPDQIRHALVSLIENSVKFRSERTPEIHVSGAPKAEVWILSVRDNGLGIDPRHADRIFGTFKRIHNDVYPGAGVGLAIAKHVVERHGGRIWVESELGQGAVFYMELPRVPAAASRTPA